MEDTKRLHMEKRKRVQSLTQVSSSRREKTLKMTAEIDTFEELSNHIKRNQIEHKYRMCSITWKVLKFLFQQLVQVAIRGRVLIPEECNFERQAYKKETQKLDYNQFEMNSQETDRPMKTLRINPAPRQPTKKMGRAQREVSSYWNTPEDQLQFYLMCLFETTQQIHEGEQVRLDEETLAKLRIIDQRQRNNDGHYFNDIEGYLSDLMAQLICVNADDYSFAYSATSNLIYKIHHQKGALLAALELYKCGSSAVIPQYSQPSPKKDEQLIKFINDLVQLSDSIYNQQQIDQVLVGYLRKYHKNYGYEKFGDEDVQITFVDYLVDDLLISTYDMRKEADMALITLTNRLILTKDSLQQALKMIMS